MHAKAYRQVRGRKPSVASIRKAVRASHYGLKDFQGVEASEIISQYVERKRLSELGITINADQIPAFLCDAFMTIERALDDIRSEEEKKRKSTARKR